MKPFIVYTLKVCLATLIASVPLTMTIGFVYIGLIMLIKPANYIFTFNLPFNHLFIFVGIIAILITFNIYLIEKMGYKRFINDRPIAHSIVIFLFYLIASGNAYFMHFDHLLFSYVPMFVTAYLFSRVFSTGWNKVFSKLTDERDNNNLEQLSDQ
ncbi:hypothetical protein G7074_07645 [Pedobacter sp. HDW13]|uniref:hypothetical protein n=1 Tax=Pedobacter sp. HDW13 TaxID=2714940 RepID=UPI00140A0B79|nr:hypothetical protein [Pedobacter sp. HDW13]QIL39166.1 hypothetical protein G7074_07645 [Pedobacter sp. HDW13]